MATKKSTSKKVTAKKAVKKTAAKKSPSRSAKKSTPKQSNLDRLVAADVISQENSGEHDQAVIKKLSAAEVSTLIKLRKKLGSAPLANASFRPNFPV